MEPKLVKKKHEEEVFLHISKMVGTSVAISGLGKVRKREQMEVFVKQKLEEDEHGKMENTVRRRPHNAHCDS